MCRGQGRAHQTVLRLGSGVKEQHPCFWEDSPGWVSWAPRATSNWQGLVGPMGGLLLVHRALGSYRVAVAGGVGVENQSWICGVQ